MKRAISPPTTHPAPSASGRRRAARDAGSDTATVLHWGHWPAADMPLTISGATGLWSFRGPFPCGADEFVLLVPFEQREQASNEARVVRAAEVHLPAATTALGAPTAPKRLAPRAVPTERAS